MIRATLMLSALLTAGCSDGAPENMSAAATNRVEAVQPPPAAAPKPSPVAAPDCPPPPTLALSDSFGESAKPYSPDSRPFQRTKAAFEAAYRQACAAAILKEAPLIPPGAARTGTLLLKNAPDANIASIYRDGEGGGPMVLEFPFVTGDGATRVPTEEELGEAIYCSVRGASDKEQEESGRCLAD